MVPPCDVRLKALPAPEGWTLLAHGAAGRMESVARWLRLHPGIKEVCVGPGIAPKVLRATAAHMPAAWEAVAQHATVHHLGLATDGYASWFVEGGRDRIWALLRHLETTPDAPLAATEIRCRPVHAGRSEAPISRRQFQTLATAVALGYYEIPHRVDLRTLATKGSVSLGCVSELLRRAEGAVLTHYVDSSLLGWPARAMETPANPFRSLDNLSRP
jgi:hypothetical protein